jgi:hypothetical protein
VPKERDRRIPPPPPKRVEQEAPSLPPVIEYIFYPASHVGKRRTLDRYDFQVWVYLNALAKAVVNGLWVDPL